MLGIRLNKEKKTIRIVNKDGNIRLAKENKSVKVVNRKENLRLDHTGKTGPQGPQGPQGAQGNTGATGVSTFVRAHHLADANMARPNALYVEWVGTVAPSNATTEDTWIHTQ
jgi:hypothetical protein